MSIFNTVYKVERNGRVFLLHWRYRFDPIITPLAIGAMAAGTGIGVAGSIQQGRQAEKIGKARAAIDIANAKATRRASVESAKIAGERGRRLIAAQKSAAAAGNIRLNVGTPLVIEAQTREDVAKDIGFSLERGREKEAFYRSRAELEKKIGKAQKRQSRWDAIRQGLMGFGSLAFMGVDAGLWGKGTKAFTPTGSPYSGARRFTSSLRP